MEYMINCAVKFGREEDMKSDELAKQVFQLSAKFDHLERMIAAQNENLQLSITKQAPRPRGLKALIELARRKATDGGVTV